MLSDLKIWSACVTPFWFYSVHFTVIVLCRKIQLLHGWQYARIHGCFFTGACQDFAVSLGFCCWVVSIICWLWFGLWLFRRSGVVVILSWAAHHGSVLLFSILTFCGIQQDVNESARVIRRMRHYRRPWISWHTNTWLLWMNEWMNEWCFRPQCCTVRLYWAGDNLG